MPNAAAPGITAQIASNITDSSGQYTIPRSTAVQDSPLCKCGEGKDADATTLAALGPTWAPFAPFATRVALSMIWPVPYLQNCFPYKERLNLLMVWFGNAKCQMQFQRPGEEGFKENCGKCHKAPDPNIPNDGKLMDCARCHNIKYCSRDHQTQHLPEHKKVCKKLAERTA